MVGVFILFAFARLIMFAREVMRIENPFWRGGIVAGWSDSELISELFYFIFNSLFMYIK